MPPTDSIAPDFFTPETAAVWLALFLLALLIDLAAGQWLYNRIPGPNTLLHPLSTYLSLRLDKSSRTPRALWVRGLLLNILFLPALVYVGNALNSLMLLDLYGDILSLLILLPCMGFKSQLRHLAEAEGLLAAPKDDKGDRFKTARSMVAQATLALVPRILIFALLFSTTGFAGLLPFLWLENLLAGTDRTRAGAPGSPFLVIPGFVYELVAFLPAIVSCLLFATAHFFLPGTRLTVYKAFNPAATIGPVSRYFPLKVLAEGLGLSMEADAGCEAENRKAFDRNPRWVSAKDGRAKLTGADVRKISIILVITIALHLLSGTMLLTALLLK